MHVLSHRTTLETWFKAAISQGSRAVDEYYKELEMLLMKTNVQEDTEATMARLIPMWAQTRDS